MVSHADGDTGVIQCKRGLVVVVISVHDGRVDVSAAAQSLAEDRDQTARRIGSMTADLEAMTLAAADSNIDDEHDPEGSTGAFERAQLLAILARARQHLADVDAALGRVLAREYGLCAQCGGPIADDRLAALPAARTCITCASG